MILIKRDGCEFFFVVNSILIFPPLTTNYRTHYRHYGNQSNTTDNGQATQLYSIHDSIAYMVLYARTAHAKASHLIKDQSSTILEGAHAGKALHDASMRGP